MKIIQKYYPSLLLFIVLIGLWELYAQAGQTSITVLPPPSLVFKSLVRFRLELLDNALYTIGEVLIGYMIAVVLAVLASFALFFSSRLRRAIYPILVIAHIVPIIALAPLLLVWLGFGIWPKIIVVVLYCFFPITATLTDGLTTTPQYLVDYAVSLGANRLQIFRYVNFPAALPHLFSGLKIAAIYSVTGAVVGEFVGAYKGLGILIQTSASSRATALVFAIITVIIILTLVFVGVIKLIENMTIGWARTS
ncbi:ABC transporter permease [Candidatus Saccharibacteria bacterium]|jgi:ABC-type nitrate/sulfonate/bicarbonate transport system permease component|nr:ABC transporter permease [Candidatus Saccharibacteria bacterium]MBP9132086.1 ABC transporter permease [Candidatus Saccharibacteria bacterium]